MLFFIVSGTIVGFVIGLLGGGGSIAAIGSSLVSVDTFGLMTAISYSLSDLVNWWIMFEFVGGGVDGGTSRSLAGSSLKQTAVYAPLCIFWCCYVGRHLHANH